MVLQVTMVLMFKQEVEPVLVFLSQVLQLK